MTGKLNAAALTLAGWLLVLAVVVTMGTGCEAVVATGQVRASFSLGGGDQKPTLAGAEMPTTIASADTPVFFAEFATPAANWRSACNLDALTAKLGELWAGVTQGVGGLFPGG